MDISGTSVVPRRKIKIEYFQYIRESAIYKGRDQFLLKITTFYLAFLTTATVCDSPPSSDFSFTRSMTPGEKHRCRSSACLPILKD